MAELLQFVDFGHYHEPEFAGPYVTDLREWAELTRRLTIPFYEEARLYWSEAIDAGDFDSINEIALFTEDFLRDLIRKYGDRDT